MKFNKVLCLWNVFVISTFSLCLWHHQGFTASLDEGQKTVSSSKRVGSPYQTIYWNPTHPRQHLLEILKRYEISTPDYKVGMGMACFAVLIGDNYVGRLRKGNHLCEELKNLHYITKQFSEKAVDFSEQGLRICLPIDNYFLKPTNGSQEYANIVILPKANGEMLSKFCLQKDNLPHIPKVLKTAGKALGVFQTQFLKDEKTHFTTAKHGDLNFGNMFCSLANKKDKKSWKIDWIDCSTMTLNNQSPLVDLGSILFHFDCYCKKFQLHLDHKIDFKEKILQGYCRNIPEALLLKLYKLLEFEKSFQNEAWLLGENNYFMSNPRAVLSFIHNFLKKYIKTTPIKTSHELNLSR